MDYVLHQPSSTVVEPPKFPGQVVLVFQGGGALGAYQGGVYQALHEAGIEPDWVIDTSIGAINAAIIAGNEIPERLPRLQAFWERIESRPLWSDPREASSSATPQPIGIPYWAASPVTSRRTAAWLGDRAPWSGSSMRPSTPPTACARRWPNSSISSA
jgi:predicted acylesterase/phospholipase RssA